MASRVPDVFLSAGLFTAIVGFENCGMYKKDCSVKYSPQRDAGSIAVCVSVLGIGVIIILFIICWVCPCCCVYKRFRNPRLVTTQYLPQPSAVVQGGWYLPYQALPNNPPYGGQPTPTGPPPSYQEAVGPGHPVPIQVAYNGGQAMYPLQSSLPTDYTSPQPVYNSAYLESQIAPVQLVKTSN